MSTNGTGITLDPVTFEVLKNSFITTVDQMAEQILRTCYSFVIYNRDFSSALNDANGDSIAQGNMDIAVHVGTLHYTCKAVIDTFKDDMRPGDVFMTNDPYAGGTHFNDVRIIRPVFVGGRDHRLRPVQRPLVRCRRLDARLLRRACQGDVPRGHPHHADPSHRRWQVAPRLRRDDRRQHARSRIDHRRHERAGRGHARRRARNPAAGREVRQGHRRHRLQGGPGLRRAGHPPAHRRASRRHLGERRLHRPRPRARRRHDLRSR